MENIKRDIMAQATGIVQPAVTVEEAIKSFNWFQELKTKALSNDDKKPIAGKPYINKSGWRKIKTLFNLSELILESRREVEDKEIRWIYRVRVCAQNGVYADAESMASTAEEFAWADKAHTAKKPEAAIMAMAQTRAFNRATSDLVGGGEQSVEEELLTDTQPAQEKTGVLNCCKCKKILTTKEQEYSLDNFGSPLCFKCQPKD